MPTALEQMVESWGRSLRARNLAPKTVTTYGESARQFTAYMAGEGVDDPTKVTKSHAEDFVTDLLQRRSAATASVRFRALQQWWNWMVDEEEVDASPLIKMRPPVVPELQLTYREAGDVLAYSERHIRRLVASGQLRAVRSGNVVRIPFAEPERFVAEQLEIERVEAS